MATILLCMLMGILTGRLTRRLPQRGISLCLTAMIWALLFLLGIEAGSNPQVIHSLPTLGFEALALAVGGTLGSLLLACVLERRLRHKRQKEKSFCSGKKKGGEG